MTVSDLPLRELVIDLETLIESAWELAWNIVLPTVLLFVGVYFTIGMRTFPLRRFGTILRSTLGQALTKQRDGASGILTSFQAWATATGSAVGTGNIAGVSSAIAFGGPGALFWYWVSAIVGMEELVGSLEVGTRADMIVFDLNTPTLTPCLTYPLRNLAHNIVYACRGDEIAYVVIDGNIVKEDGKVMFMDEENTLREAQDAAEDLMQVGAGDYLTQRSLLVKQAEEGLF